MFNNVVLPVFDHYWQTFDSMSRKFNNFELGTVKTKKPRSFDLNKTSHDIYHILQEGTVMNPAIWLVLIFLSLTMLKLTLSHCRKKMNVTYIVFASLGSVRPQTGKCCQQPPASGSIFKTSVTVFPLYVPPSRQIRYISEILYTLTINFTGYQEGTQG